jgi:hypothetical protein
MNPDPTSLDRLHDIVAPRAVAWWPPAPGWYWLLGGAVVLFCVLAVRALIRWQHNRYRREALAELSGQEVALRDPVRRIITLPAVAELLKRTAVTAYPREEVATLTGAPWFEFLDRTERASLFMRGDGAILERSAYDPRTAVDIDDRKTAELVSEVRYWIKHHEPRKGFSQKVTKETKGEGPDSDVGALGGRPATRVRQFSVEDERGPGRSQYGIRVFKFLSPSFASLPSVKKPSVPPPC